MKHNKEVLLVESRAESDAYTGERKGPWYPCGYEVHRTKKMAEKEIQLFMGVHCLYPYRISKYRRVGP